MAVVTEWTYSSRSSAVGLLEDLLDKLNNTLVRIHLSFLQNNGKHKTHIYFFFPGTVLRGILMDTSYSSVSNDSNSVQNQIRHSWVYNSCVFSYPLCFLSLVSCWIMQLFSDFSPFTQLSLNRACQTTKCCVLTLLCLSKVFLAFSICFKKGSNRTRHRRKTNITTNITTSDI